MSTKVPLRPSMSNTVEQPQRFYYSSGHTWVDVEAQTDYGIGRSLEVGVWTPDDGTYIELDHSTTVQLRDYLNTAIEWMEAEDERD